MSWAKQLPSSVLHQLQVNMPPRSPYARAFKSTVESCLGANGSALQSTSTSHLKSDIRSSSLPVNGKVNIRSFYARIAPPQSPYLQQKRFSSTKVTETTQVPDFSSYKTSNENDPSKGRAFTYVMLGTTGFIGAVSAKNFVVDFLAHLGPSSDVLAQAKAELDLSGIPEGKNVTIKWRGKPIFVRHRTEHEISDAQTVDMASLRDPQSDADRVKKPEWIVLLGVCTHLGCVPLGDSGDFHGWFCPCHGSHYDISGRIRKGPAPLNLEIPPYDFDGHKLIIGWLKLLCRSFIFISCNFFTCPEPLGRLFPTSSFLPILTTHRRLWVQ